MSGIIGGIVAGILVVSLRLAARNASAAFDAGDGTRIARYPFIARAATWMLMLVPLGLWLALFTVTAADQVVIGAAVCCCLSVAALILLLEFNLARASWSESGLVFHSSWRKARSIDWKDVTDVRFSTVASWVAVRGSSGVRIRLSSLLVGLADLFEALRIGAPRTLGPSIDEAASQWRKSVSTRKLLGLPTID